MGILISFFRYLTYISCDETLAKQTQNVHNFFSTNNRVLRLRYFHKREK